MRTTKVTIPKGYKGIFVEGIKMKSIDFEVPKDTLGIFVDGVHWVRDSVYEEACDILNREIDRLRDALRKGEKND